MRSGDTHGEETAHLIAAFVAMVAAREIDMLEQQMIRRGEAHFHVSGRGHEVLAVLGPLLSGHDWLHCHYRDKALLIARGLPLQQFFDNLLCKQSSSSAGRQLNAFFSSPELRILSMVTPTANNALQAVGVAAAIRQQPTRPIVYCAVGDGSTQQAEYLAALAEAARERLPVLFVIEDNGWAISTNTRGRTFYADEGGALRSFHGIAVDRLNGRDAVTCYRALGDIISAMRDTRAPHIVVIELERLDGHTSADDQSLYRSSLAIDEARAGSDPVRRLRDALLARGVDAQIIADIEREQAHRVAMAARAAAAGCEPEPCFDAAPPGAARVSQPAVPVIAEHSMRSAIADVLHRQLAADPRVMLLGEDIEDPKGDVFGVTRGLSTA